MQLGQEYHQMNPRKPRIPQPYLFDFGLSDGAMLEEDGDDILSTEHNKSIDFARTLYFSEEIQIFPEKIKATIWNEKINNLIVQENSLKEPFKEDIANGQSVSTLFFSDENFDKFKDFLNQIDTFVEETNWQIISNRKSFLYYKVIGATLGITTAIALIYSAPIGLGLYLLSTTLGALCGVATVQLLAFKNSYACFGLFKPPSVLTNFAEKLRENIPTQRYTISMQGQAN